MKMQNSKVSGLINHPYLIKQGFEKDCNGKWCKCFTTHYLELIESKEGYFYPMIVQPPELSCDSEQCVSVKRVKTVSELSNLIKVIF